MRGPWENQAGSEQNLPCVTQAMKEDHLQS